MQRVLPALVIILYAHNATSAEELKTATPIDTFIRQSLAECQDSHDTRRFIDALHVELSSGDFNPSEASSLRALTCDVANGRLTLRLSNREMSVDVSDVPKAARARTLAVALAETLKLPTSDLMPAAASHPARATYRSRVATIAAPRRRPHARHLPIRITASQLQPEPGPKVTVPLGLRALVMGPEHTVGIGATLGANVELTEWLRAGAHIGYLASGHRSSLGTSRLHAASLEGGVESVLLRSSVDSTLDVGVNLALYRAAVVVESAWGIDEPKVSAWFSLVSLHLGLTTLLSERVRGFTRLIALRNLDGLRLRSGGERALSFYGFGAEVRLGAGYVW